MDSSLLHCLCSLTKIWASRSGCWKCTALGCMCWTERGWRRKKKKKRVAISVCPECPDASKCLMKHVVKKRGEVKVKSTFFFAQTPPSFKVFVHSFSFFFALMKMQYNPYFTFRRKAVAHGLGSSNSNARQAHTHTHTQEERHYWIGLDDLICISISKIKKTAPFWKIVLWIFQPFMNNFQFVQFHPCAMPHRARKTRKSFNLSGKNNQETFEKVKIGCVTVHFSLKGPGKFVFPSWPSSVCACPDSIIGFYLLCPLILFIHHTVFQWEKSFRRVLLSFLSCLPTLSFFLLCLCLSVFCTCT